MYIKLRLDLELQDPQKTPRQNEISTRLFLPFGSHSSSWSSTDSRRETVMTCMYHIIGNRKTPRHWPRTGESRSSYRKKDYPSRPPLRDYNLQFSSFRSDQRDENEPVKILLQGSWKQTIRRRHTYPFSLAVKYSRHTYISGWPLDEKSPSPT